MQPTQVGSRLFFTRPERENRDTAKSAVVSALFHFSIVLALVLLTRTGVLIATGELGVGTGIGTGAAGGGGGGGQDDIVSVMMAVADPEPPAADQLTVPTKVEPVPEPPKIEEKPVEELELATADTTPTVPAVTAPAANPTGGTGTGEGTGTGSGTGPGTGPGSGGGTGGGSGGGIGSGVGPGTGRGSVLKPSPEVLMVPPPAPGNVRGKTVIVHLSVDTTGIVRDADIVPSTGNRKFDETLKRTALGWKFRPARNELGKPVAVIFPVTFTF